MRVAGTGTVPLRAMCCLLLRTQAVRSSIGTKFVERGPTDCGYHRKALALGRSVLLGVSPLSEAYEKLKVFLIRVAISFF